MTYYSGGIIRHFYTSILSRSKDHRLGWSGPISLFSEHRSFVTTIVFSFLLQRSHALSDSFFVKMSSVRSVRVKAASITEFTCSSEKLYPKHAKRLIGFALCAKHPRKVDHIAEYSESIVSVSFLRCGGIINLFVPLGNDEL